ncbi:hypothetical protein C8Q80DRAFT_1268429 [Daedaleopsis nitida]|nr:hypothetical protein C8Q80DRAFT_1268429 [Daedaleopsis nitida]
MSNMELIVLFLILSIFFPLALVLATFVIVVPFSGTHWELVLLLLSCIIFSTAATGIISGYASCSGLSPPIWLRTNLNSLTPFLSRFVSSGRAAAAWSHRRLLCTTRGILDAWTEQGFRDLEKAERHPRELDSQVVLEERLTLMRNFADKEAEVFGLKQKLGLATTEADSAKEELSQARTRFEGLLADYLALEQQSQARESALRADVVSVKQQLAKSETVNSTLRDEIVTLRAENAAVKEQLTMSHTANTTLRTEIDHLRAENVTFKEQLAGSTAKNNALRSENDSVRQQLIESTTDNNTLRLQIDTLHAENVSVNDALGKSGEDLQIAREKFDNLEVVFRTLAGDSQNETDKLAELETEVGRLKLELDDAKALAVPISFAEGQNGTLLLCAVTCPSMELDQDRSTSTEGECNEELLVDGWERVRAEWTRRRDDNEEWAVEETRETVTQKRPPSHARRAAPHPNQRISKTAPRLTDTKSSPLVRKAPSPPLKAASSLPRKAFLSLPSKTSTPLPRKAPTPPRKDPTPPRRAPTSLAKSPKPVPRVPTPPRKAPTPPVKAQSPPPRQPSQTQPSRSPVPHRPLTSAKLAATCPTRQVATTSKRPASRATAARSALKTKVSTSIGPSSSAH